MNAWGKTSKLCGLSERCELHRLDLKNLVNIKVQHGGHDIIRYRFSLSHCHRKERKVQPSQHHLFSSLIVSVWQMSMELKVRVFPTGVPSEVSSLPSPTRTRTRVWVRVPLRGSASLPVQDRGQRAPPPPTSTTSTSHPGPTHRPTLQLSCLHPQVWCRESLSASMMLLATLAAGLVGWQSMLLHWFGVMSSILTTIAWIYLCSPEDDL